MEGYSFPASSKGFYKAERGARTREKREWGVMGKSGEQWEVVKNGKEKQTEKEDASLAYRYGCFRPYDLSARSVGQLIRYVFPADISS